MILAPSFGSKSSKVRTHTTFCLKKDINLGLFQKRKKIKWLKHSQMVQSGDCIY